MAVKFTETGWARWLEVYVRQAAYLRLFVGSGKDPSKLVEVDAASGYKAEALVGARWQIASTNAIVRANYPEVLWRLSQRVPVSGAYVADKAGEVLWWEEFPLAGAEPPALDLHALQLCIELDTEN